MTTKKRRTPARTQQRDWKPAWLEAFEKTGMVMQACKIAKVGRSTVYDARQRDETFALAWADVEEATTERMEREAYRRAVEGVHRDVFHRGQVVGAEQHYSDTLLIFMLKARRPDKYRENLHVEHGGRVTQAIELPVDAAERSRRAVALLAEANAVGDSGV